MPFRIRDAVPSPSDDDAKFITAAFDSCIPHLCSIGSSGQWGTTPLSTARPGFQGRHAAAIADAEAYRLASAGPSSDSTPAKPVRVLIAEAVLPSTDSDGAKQEQRYLPVGAATLRANYLPQYVLDQEHLRGVTGPLMADGAPPFMFLEVLVTDFSEATREHRKGAGAALVQFAKEWAGKELGMDAMYVDCWAGNGEKLVKYVSIYYKRDKGFADNELGSMNHRDSKELMAL